VGERGGGGRGGSLCLDKWGRGGPGCRIRNCLLAPLALPVDGLKVKDLLDFRAAVDSLKVCW
jgi:hypothetical protein